MKNERKTAVVARSGQKKRHQRTVAPATPPLETEYLASFGSDLPESLKSLEGLAPARQEAVVFRHFVTYSAYEDPI